jgi:hypothetical protein
MSAHQAMYPIRTMARVLKVSASGYYAWRSRPASARAIADADLTRHIRTIHAGSHGTYGAPRVHAELKANGLSAGRKRIARLMRVAGIAGVSRRRSAPITTRQATDHHPASDLVRRNFMAERPNELWVADITFLPTLAGFLYLAVVLDAWSRRIVGWAFSADLKTRVVLDALDMALVARKPDNVVHHSDSPRFAIHVGCFRQSLQGSRRSSIDRLDCRRLRQCDVASPPISRRGADGRLSVHRRLLQSLKLPLGAGLPFAHRTRKETPWPKQARLTAR